MEHPAQRAGFRQVAAVLANYVAKFADDAIAIRGDRLDQHPHAARSVALESHFFVLFPLKLTGAAQDGSLDVLTRHVLILASQDGGAKARVRVRIAAANARSDRDFADYPGENAAALGVGGRLLVLDRGPF